MVSGPDFHVVVHITSLVAILGIAVDLPAYQQHVFQATAALMGDM